MTILVCYTALDPTKTPALARLRHPRKRGETRCGLDPLRAPHYWGGGLSLQEPERSNAGQSKCRSSGTDEADGATDRIPGRQWRRISQRRTEPLKCCKLSLTSSAVHQVAAYLPSTDAA